MKHLSRKQLARKNALIARKASQLDIEFRTKDEAKAAGLKRYFDGKLCPSNHISERYVATGKCVECLRASVVSWRKNNPERHNDNCARYQRERFKDDPSFALRVRARWIVGNAIKRMGYKKGSRTEEIIGCSFEEFKAHIERQFLPGMTWENRGEWHIDHIVPISSGASESEVLSLNHYTNLRPLWAEDNLKKSNKAEFLI